MVNPDKSKIWFSKACDRVCREAILTAIQAKVAGEKEKYLGIYMPNRVREKDWTPQLLEDQFGPDLAACILHVGLTTPAFSHKTTDIPFAAFHVGQA
jgi:hypothetical protein